MAIINRFLSTTNTAAWAPWLVVGAMALYIVGYVDAGVHAAAVGSPGVLGTVHEFFHHARHVAFMCH
jgi:hypothetical protein